MNKIKPEYLTVFVVFLGWIISAVWIVASVKQQVADLRMDNAKMERQIERVDDKVERLYWYMRGNEGPFPPLEGSDGTD